ncbi:MAG: glycosyltransferase [Rhodobacteraceae bacterium]|nr:glycosyltransferase [Paracoccaceae bacterium]MCZ8083886.1 glycosyltransferase [Paracoccaceae bacterium]
MSVSCIIPAWNEAERLPLVLRAVVGHPAVDEVIVVDDGSQDGSADVAQAMGASVLRQRRNGGKSAAVAAGVAQAQGDLILLLDADLVGLTAMQVMELLAPVRSGRADVAISLRQNAPWVWRRIELDYISGERVMRREMLLPWLNRMAGLKGFGLEVFLNRLWIADRARVAVVGLAAISPSKAAKQGLLRGIAGDVGMMRDIFGTIGAVAALRQIMALRRLRQTEHRAYRAARVSGD